MARAVSPARGPRLPRSARREQLLRAARDVFVAQGYHAAAMDDIAERAGVSKPVLYQHFPGKLELYLALLDTQIDALVERLLAALAATTDNRQRVSGAVGTYFDFVDREGEAFRLLFESDLRNDPQVRGRVDRAVHSCVDAVAGTIAADTGAEPARAHLLAVGLTGLAEVSARWWLDRRDSAEGDRRDSAEGDRRDSAEGDRRDSAEGDRRDDHLDKDQAVALMSALAWRGISGFPRQAEGSPGFPPPEKGGPGSPTA